MARWNEKDGISVDGDVTAIKFRGNDGTLIRVSTDNIPKKYMKDPTAPFDKIHAVLRGYLKKDNLVK
ncbi:MAG: hypothetical protein PUA74_07125 [Clostridiales bacterium]|nr:hypothetical protein [Clostridiales bacterium]